MPPWFALLFKLMDKLHVFVKRKLEAKAKNKERFEVFQNVSLCTLEGILKCAFTYDQDIQNAG